MILSGKKHNNDGSRFYLIALLYVVSKQKKTKKKNENTECHGIFIPFKSQVNSKQGSFIYLLFAVIQRCSVKKVFLEILQNLQQNTCARVSFFNKVADLRLKACNFLTVTFM